MLLPRGGCTLFDMKQIAVLQAVLAVLLLVGASLTIPALAFGSPSTTTSQATEPCVPQEAYDEVIHHGAVTHTETVIDQPAYDEVVVDAEAVDRWWHWTGGPDGPQGNPPPADGWKSDNGNHFGFPDVVNEIIQRDKGHHGNADYFYHEVVEEQSHVEHHDAVTHEETVVDQEAYDEVIHHDAVTCPPPPCEGVACNPGCQTDCPTTEPTPTEEPTVTPTPTPTPEPDPVPPTTPTVIHAGL